MHNNLTVALIGRPNAGKSTLYNRLTHSNDAIVNNKPGVTRDWREGEGRIGDLEFTVIDTGGLEEANPSSMSGKIYAQTSYIMQQAGLILMVIDGVVGVTGEDEKFARLLRATGKKIILVVNKCESSKRSYQASEAFRLGFSHTIFISAAHGEGLGDLYQAINQHLAELAKHQPAIDNDAAKPSESDEKSRHISLAIIGRPNAGKSTFVNQLLGKQRMITSPVAGTTRDSISSAWQYGGYEFTLVDTAGIRKRANIVEELEKLAVLDSFKALRYAHVVALMVDATAPLERQELKLAERILEEGRALILVVNKIDLIPAAAMAKKQEEIDYLIETSFPAFRGLPVVYISALADNFSQQPTATNRPLRKLVSGREVLGDLGAQNRSVLDIHEDSSTKSTTQFSAETEFPKRSNGQWHNPAISQVMQAVISTYQRWNKRITTGKLNDWLAEVTSAHSLPLLHNGRRVKMKYITQAKTRPPSFMINCNRPEAVNDSYQRYLINNLRRSFGLEGVPIRLHLKKSANPFENN